jgi:CobQ-like glutamine amidotransferase family enzyme
MSRPSSLRIARLFPEVLGTYGDGGNALVLERRMAWRGLAAELVDVPLGRPVPADCDLYLLGGGEDDAQTLAVAALRRSPGLSRAVDRGRPVLAVCAGLQLLGRSFEVRGGVETGLGLLDLTTTRLPVRAVGEAVAQPDPALGLPPLTGFENHGGGSELGPAARPLATVVSGFGNGNHREEGALQGSIVATYLHGPVLARNPALADLLLERATGGELPALQQPEVDALRRTLLVAHRSGRARRRLLRHS